MKSLFSKIVPALVLTLASFAASAAPINGGFSISGGALPLGGTDSATATGITFQNTPAISVLNCSGDISSILGGSTCGGATATVADIAVNSIPLGSGGALAYTNNNWITLSSGGITFSITGITAYDHSADFSELSLAGTGLMSANGYDSTAGSFRFTMQDANAQTFSFSSSEISSGSVPVPGSLALLGIGVIGAAVSSRKKKA